MKTFRRSLIVLSVCSFLAPAGWTRSQSPAASNSQQQLLPATEEELAMARKGTAKYHDIAEAEADGYVDIHLYLPGHPPVLSATPINGAKTRKGSDSGK